MHDGHVHFKGQEESVQQLQLMLNEKGRFEGAAALLKAVDKPIVAPSANLSKHTSPVTAQHVYDDLTKL